MSGRPFRAEHVGSLLRPPHLRQAFRDVEAGKITPQAFEDAQDAAISAAVALQERLGFGAVTDGEFRRASYWSHFAQGIDGLAVDHARFEFRNEKGEREKFLAPHVTSRLKRAISLSGAEFDYLREVTSAVPKITLPSPPTLHFWDKSGSWRAAGYTDRDAYFADIAQIFKDEIADLAQRGCRYIQLDDVPLAMLCDPNIRDAIGAQGEDAGELLGAYVDLFNASLAGHPKDMTVGIHVCRGNFKGRWLSEGGYDYVAEKLFNAIDADVYFLEFDTPRAGDFACLKSLPKDKAVVLGLISSKTPVMEGARDVERRIAEAARAVPLDNLAVSPQCGFASAVSGNPLSPDDQTAKLKLVVDVARDVWK